MACPIPKYLKGDKGDKGDRGERGLRGYDGKQGLKGDKGDKGLKGDKGDKGLKGDKGDKGLKGDKGDKGLKGDRGLRGYDGEKGDKGDKGDRGLQGIQGERGPAGIGGRGRDGRDGKDGTTPSPNLIRSIVRTTSRASTGSSGGQASLTVNQIKVIVNQEIKKSLTGGNGNTQQLEAKIKQLEAKIKQLEGRTQGVDESQLRLILKELETAILQRVELIRGDVRVGSNTLDQQIKVLGASTDSLSYKLQQFVNNVLNKLAELLTKTPNNSDVLEAINACCQMLKTELDNVPKKDFPDPLMEKIWKVLGGSNWEGGTTPYLRVNPEVEIEEYWQPLHYGTNNINSENPQELIVNNILDFIQAHVLTTFFRLGGEHFPIKAPQSFTSLEENPSLQLLDSVAEFNHYQLLALDELIGQFPIQIKVAKDHPINRRKVDIRLMSADNKATTQSQTITPDQDTEVKIPNLAEGIAELIGQNIASHTHLLTLQRIGFSSLAELAILKKLAIEGDSKSKAILTYLGIDIKEEVSKLPLTFNPLSTSQDLDEHLSPTEVDFTKSIYKLGKDNPSLQQQIKNLLFAATIIKGAMWQEIDTNKPVESLKKLFKDQIKADKDLDENQEDEWDEFIENVEAGFITEVGISDPVNPYGVNYNQRPQIREIGTITGDNNNGTT